MKPKQKDDILGEDQTDLPINEGKRLAKVGNFYAELYSAWWLSKRRMQLEASLFLSTPDTKRR